MRRGPRVFAVSRIRHWRFERPRFIAQPDRGRLLETRHIGKALFRNCLSVSKRLPGAGGSATEAIADGMRAAGLSAAIHLPA
jgi:hypothetical protein